MRGRFVKGRKLSALAQEFIGNECPVCYGPMWAFWFGDEGITWGGDESACLNIAWKIYLKKEFDFDLTNENVFAMSLLHELGHYYTWDQFDEDEWNADRAHEDKINKTMTVDNFFDKQAEYFNMPTERAATAWAIDTYRASGEVVMRHWNRRFNCAIRHFEKTTGKVVFERF